MRNQWKPCLGIDCSQCNQSGLLLSYYGSECLLSLCILSHRLLGEVVAEQTLRFITWLNSVPCTCPDGWLTKFSCPTCSKLIYYQDVVCILDSYPKNDLWCWIVPELLGDCGSVADWAYAAPLLAGSLLPYSCEHKENAWLKFLIMVEGYWWWISHWVN